MNRVKSIIFPTDYKQEKTKMDCGFARDNKWFRYRAGAIIVEDGKILFATDDTIDYFYTVGGGVHHGEKAEDCVKREVFEETGVEYEVDHLAMIVENFFKGESSGSGFDGMDCHCLEMYFVMKSRGFSKIESKSLNSNGAVERMVWIPIDEIEKYNIKPSFLKAKIKEVVNGNGIVHMVTDADR